MRKIFVSMALFLCLFLPAVAQAWEAIVTYIKDGDSFVVERPDGERVEIRLLGVDCPERNQRFGWAATTYAIELLLNQRVGIVEVYQDVYDRTVGAVVTLENGRVMQDMLLIAGLGWVDPRFCPDCTSWFALEEQSRNLGIGLWAEECPIPPWDWRRGVRAVE